MRAATLALSSLCLALTTSCLPRKKTASTAESLDNLAKGGKDITVNICKGETPYNLKWEGRINLGDDIKTNAKFKDHPEVEKRYKDAVKRYLSAVPHDLQEVFLAFGGEIMLTGSAITHCNQTAKSGQGQSGIQPAAGC